MRNSVLATALLVLFLGCGSAWAADPASATYNWTGFYAGLNTGFAKDAGGYSITSPSGVGVYDTGDFTDLAFIFGGQAGYNFQWCTCPNIVYGIETDINYEGMGDSITQSFGVPVAIAPGALSSGSYNVTQEIDFFGTLRGRLGYTPVDRLLLYVTGGLAYGEVSSSTKYSVTFRTDPTYLGSSSDMLVGWCAGAGGEYAINNCWSVKLEYLYVDLGSMSYPIAGTPLTTNISAAQNVFRVGLNYKF